VSTTLKFDLVDRLALSFLVVGLLLFSLGLILDTRALGNLMQVFVDEWTPGLVIDGLLLLVVNRIIRNNERSGVLAQVASLSNDFALDAVRRARTEGWLEDGSMRGRNLRKAKLNSADLSGASFTQTDFGYADLSEASLTHANLRGANLTGANLQRADLRWADLRGAKLRWANLLDAHLDGARFDDADLTFASVDQEFAATHKNCGAIVGGYLRCEQVNTIRKTFAQIECAGEAPIRLFYQKLFEARPELQAMFSSSQQRQSQNLRSQRPSGIKRSDPLNSE